jgi:hypothetical protein
MHNKQSNCQCHCHGGEVSPSLWSRAKKIRVLEEKLESMNARKAEIELMIDELKQEKQVDRS